MRRKKIITFKTSSSLGNPRIKNRTILPNNYHYLTNNFQPKKPKQHKTWQSFALCPIPHTATAKTGKKKTQWRTLRFCLFKSRCTKETSDTFKTILAQSTNHETYQEPSNLQKLLGRKTWQKTRSLN